MTLRLLYADEMRGFYKSNVMIVLWIGLPLLAIVSYLFFPDVGDQTSITYVTSSIISSIGGWLAAMMLAIHEKSHHVYELFLIRPVRRSHIILSKYFAVLSCVALACLLALIVGFITDYFILDRFSNILFMDTLRSFVIGFAIIAIECAAGAFVGVLVSSVLVGVILVVITHNIASLTIIVPIMTKATNVHLLSISSGIILSAVFLSMAIEIFRRKEL
jgi:ABC-2 type transport system permease protein